MHKGTQRNFPFFFLYCAGFIPLGDGSQVGSPLFRAFSAKSEPKAQPWAKRLGTANRLS